MENTTPRRIWILAGLYLLGLGFSIYLTQHYYELHSGGMSFKSLCNIGSSLNCDTVTLSKYSTFLGSVPLSSFATGWYLALILICLTALSSEWRQESLKIAFLMTGFSLVMSIIYLVIMAAVIHTFCLFCLGVDLVNLIAFGILFSLKPWTAAKKPVPSRWQTFAGITAGSVLVAVLALKGLEISPDPTAQEIQEKLTEVAAAPVVAVSADAAFPSFGSPQAKITIVEFSDFACPYCKLGALTLKALESRYPNDLRVVFRNFPLDMACNPEVKRAMHAYSCEAARAGYCAQKQGKFQNVYEAYFENQEKFGAGKILDFAKEAGADGSQLEACMATREASSAVMRDITEGVALKINSTPTFFFNGKKIEGSLPFAAWSALIEQTLHPQ